MRAWKQSDMEKVSSNPAARLASESSISEDRGQIIRMIEFVEKLALSQEVMENTREENILDLLFSSDPELVESSEVLKNVSISDHNFVIATLNREYTQETESRKINFCSTEIPLYNLSKGSTEDWNNARIEFEARKYREDITVEDFTIEIIKNLEISVKNNFKKHSPPTNTEGSSKNFIPREVRCILRRKLNASRSLSKTQDIEKQKSLKTKIEALEEQLRLMMHKKRKHIEYKASKDLKKNPKIFSI